MHHFLSGSALKQYAEFQELKSTQMLAEYIYKPKHWYQNCSTVLETLLGANRAVSLRHLSQLVGSGQEEN